MAGGLPGLLALIFFGWLLLPFRPESQKRGQRLEVESYLVPSRGTENQILGKGTKRNWHSYFVQAIVTLKCRVADDWRNCMTLLRHRQRSALDLCLPRWPLLLLPTTVMYTAVSGLKDFKSQSQSDSLIRVGCCEAPGNASVLVTQYRDLNKQLKVFGPK